MFYSTQAFVELVIIEKSGPNYGSGANAINLSGLLNPKKLGNFKN